MHRPLVTFIARATLLFSLAALSCGGPQRNPDASMNRFRIAVDEFRRGELPSAVTDVKAAIKYDGSNAEAHNLYGLIQFQRGVDSLSLAEIRRCERGGVGDALKREAATFFLDAERHFKRAVAARSDSAEAWNNLANLAIQLRRYKEAVKYANEALANAPKLASVETARANLGWAYFHMGDLVRAEQELLQATAQKPLFCIGAYRLAKVYWERNEPQRVIDALSQVMKKGICPVIEAHALLALAHAKVGQLGRARRSFEACVQLGGESCAAVECKQSLVLLPQSATGDEEEEDSEVDPNDGGSSRLEDGHEGHLKIDGSWSEGSNVGSNVDGDST